MNHIIVPANYKYMNRYYTVLGEMTLRVFYRV